MSNRDIMYAAWLVIGGMFISQIIQGAYFGQSDIDTANSLMAFRTYDLFGLIPIPLLNINFFTVGLKSLVTWNFAFFDGAGYDMTKYVFYVISIGIVWGIAATFAGFTFFRSANLP